MCRGALIEESYVEAQVSGCIHWLGGFTSYWPQQL